MHHFSFLSLSLFSFKKFSIQASYHGTVPVPSESTSIGSFTVQSVPDSVKVNDEQPPWITVQLSQDGNGMLCFSKATSIEAYVEEVEETIEVIDEEAQAQAEAAAAEEQAKAEAAAAAAAAEAPPAEGDEGKKDGEKAEDEGKKESPPSSSQTTEKMPVPPKMKKIVKKSRKRKYRDTDMEFTLVYDGEPTQATVMECEEVEAKMAQQDRLIKETDDARNDLET